jgi:Protein of unknown function (DUF1345)
LQAGLALISVFVSWTPIHTLFTLKYARLYYSWHAGGIDFNETDEPDYGDFAYLSFTIGMTFQVSDTNIQSNQIRRTALRHAWLAFPLGVVIIATTINLWPGWPNDCDQINTLCTRTSSQDRRRASRAAEPGLGRRSDHMRSRPPAANRRASSSRSSNPARSSRG